MIRLDEGFDTVLKNPGTIMKMSLLIIVFIPICYAQYNMQVLQWAEEIFSKSQGSSQINISVRFLNDRSYDEDTPSMLSLICNISGVDGEIWWAKDEMTLTDPVETLNDSNIGTIMNIELDSEEDAGDFTCVAETTNGTILNKTVHIGKIVFPRMKPRELEYKVRVNESVTLSCDVEGYPLSNFTWTRPWYGDYTAGWVNATRLTYINETHARMSIEFETAKREDAETYDCEATDYYGNLVGGSVTLKVSDVPWFEMKRVIPVGTDTVYFEFAIDNGDNPDLNLIIEYLKNNTEEWSTPTVIYDVGENGYVIPELEYHTAYKFKIVFTNSIGSSEPVYSGWVTTLEEEPEFVPIVWIEATTLDSIKIGWSAPPRNLRIYLSKYEVISSHDNEAPYVENTTFVFENLRPETNYKLKVRACNRFNRQCCDWSPETEAVTIDRDIKFVPNVTVTATNLTSITIGWTSPQLEMRDCVHQYKVIAIHRNHEIGPVQLPIGVNSYVFDNLESETSYVVKVAACSEYITQCGNWSSEIEGVTVDDVLEKEAQMVISPIWIVAVVLSIIVGTWIGIRRRRRKAKKQKMMRAALERFEAGALDCLNPELNISDQAELLPYNKKWEFPRELLKLDKILGSGAFGIVRKAQAQSIRRPEMVTTVAVKLVRSTHRLNYMTALDRELKILGYLGKHLNVVNLLGACTKNVNYGELLVIVEFCRFGNLRDYLIRRREDFVSQIDDTSAGPITASSNSCNDTLENSENFTNDKTETESSTPVTDAIEPVRQSKYQGDFTDEDLKPIETRDLICWIWQVSRGMKFLGSRRVIHGDLAARNILLADHNVVKICDFGMAKALQADEDYKKKGHDPLPVKWMAIESLRDRVFSYKSDIWSFGIVLWEFFTLGATPYPGIDPGSLYQKLKDGFRMDRPKYATKEIYNMMRCCWNAEPAKRPSFEQLENILVDLLDETVKSHYIELSQPYVKMNDDALSHGETDYLTMTPSGEGTSNNTIDETQV